MDSDIKYVVLADNAFGKQCMFISSEHIKKEYGIVLFNFYKRKKTKDSYYDTWLYAVKDQKKLMLAAMKYNLTFYKTFND